MTQAGPLLVTGGSGQLATALETLAIARRLSVRRVGRPDFDFDRPASIGETMQAVRPSAVINAAAYTAVDAAESDGAAAYRANRDGPGVLAACCAEQGIPFLHVSTDYVFDGTKDGWYVETDPTNPQGVYGASKLAGEAAVLSAHPFAVVARTAWVYAAEGKNFVRTMLRLAERMPKLRVVADQVGCPTAAGDLAAALLDMLPSCAAPRPQRVFHLAGTGSTSWHGFATAIFESAARYGAATPAVEPIGTADYPTPAKRPANSRLDCGLAARAFGVRLPPWRASLDRTIDAIFAARD